MTLTINIDEENLAKVKQLAQSSGETVERVIEKYLKKILLQGDLNTIPTSKEEMESSTGNQGVSATEEIRRLQQEAGIQPISDFDEKQDFRDHIKRKHA